MSIRGPLATLSLITMAFWSWLLVVLQFLLSGCVCPNITSWRMWELIVVSHFFSNNCNCPPVPLLDVISDGDRRLLIKEKRSMTCLCTSFSQHVFSGSLGFFRLVWSHFYLESLEKQLKRRARAQLFYLSTFECNLFGWVLLKIQENWIGLLWPDNFKKGKNICTNKAALTSD